MRGWIRVGSTYSIARPLLRCTERVLTAEEGLADGEPGARGGGCEREAGVGFRLCRVGCTAGRVMQELHHARADRSPLAAPMGAAPAESEAGRAL